jgi:predicted PurR-regulated permease PerM
MKTKDKIIIGFIILLIFGYALYKIKYILTPFIIAIIASYLLDPAISKLQRLLKISRLVAVSIITSLFILAIFIFGGFILPLLFNETINLLNSTPQFLAVFSNNFYPKIVDFFAKFNIRIEHNFVDLVSNNISLIYDPEFISKILQNLITSTTFIINVISLIFICPILVFYLLKDWNIIIAKIDNSLPKKYIGEIHELFILINKSVANFLRGQTLVCIILAVYYSITLKFLGLNNGILIGFLTGILSFIPYIGYGIGLTIALIYGIFQWGVGSYYFGFVIITYLIGQLIESNYLVPNLIGKQINLHPIWVIFGIFFFGAIFGFVGVLLSLPLTAISSVVLKYFFNNYQSLKSK